MKQIDKVKKAVQAGAKSIQAVFDFTGGTIPRPSIRRVLGQGAIKGIFKREDKGIYTLTTPEGEVRAYIEAGLSEHVLPRMEAEGRKFDMVFIDPAYFSRALIGGNRKPISYDFIHMQEFAIAMKCIHNMMRTDDSHVYLMISNAGMAQLDMHKYLFAAMESGLKHVTEGKYTKTYKSGKEVINIRGKKASFERLLLFTRSGKYRTGECPDLQMDYTVERPPVKTSYSTQKSEDLLNQLILQSTFEHEHVGELIGAGSGVFGKCALMLNRIVTLVEKSVDAIENYIVPKIEKFAL